MSSYPSSTVSRYLQLEHVLFPSLARAWALSWKIFDRSSSDASVFTLTLSNLFNGSVAPLLELINLGR